VVYIEFISKVVLKGMCIWTSSLHHTSESYIYCG